MTGHGHGARRWRRWRWRWWQGNAARGGTVASCKLITRRIGETLGNEASGDRPEQLMADGRRVDQVGVPLRVKFEGKGAAR